MNTIFLKKNNKKLQFVREVEPKKTYIYFTLFFLLNECFQVFIHRDTYY